MRRIIPLLLVGLTTATSSFAAESGISVNDVQRQKVPVAVMDDDGSALVVWHNTRLGIMSRVVPVADPSSASAPERLLIANTHVPSVPGEGIVLTHREPAVVSDDDGGFWLFWSRERAFLKVVPFHENRQVLSQDIRLRHYDRNGEPTGPATLVSPAVGLQSQPRAIRTSDGGIAVTWRSDDVNPNSTAGDGVFVRLFDAEGKARGAAVRVSAATQEAAWPALAADSRGRVLVLWHAPDADTLGIYRALLNAGGDLVSPAQRVNATTAGRQTQPAAIARPDGGFLVLWQGAVGLRLKTQIFARNLDAAARPSGSESIISSGVLEYEMGPAIVRTGRDTFFAAWVSWDSSFPRAMRGIELTTDGAMVGEERNLNSFRLDAVYRAFLAHSDRDGTFALWEGFLQRGRKAFITGRPLEFLD